MKTIIFTSLYDYGDVVYNKTDPEQLPGIVTGVLYAEAIRYEVSFGRAPALLYQAIELSSQRDICLLTGSENKEE